MVTLYKNSPIVFAINQYHKHPCLKESHSLLIIPPHQFNDLFIVIHETFVWLSNCLYLHHTIKSILRSQVIMSVRFSHLLLWFSYHNLMLPHPQ